MAPKKRIYPHLSGVKDNDTNSALRILFDKVFGTEDIIEQLESKLKLSEGQLADAKKQLIAMDRKVNVISLPAAESPAPSSGAGSSGGSGSSPDIPIEDGGGGSSGCTQSGDTGHVDPGLPLSVTTAGMIICGTAKEFPVLTAPQVTLADRETAAAELLGRMIWHLQQHGFTAGRQNNSESTIRLSKDKITFQVDGTMRVYDVFQDVSDYTSPLRTRMINTAPARYVADGGTAD